MRLNHINYTKDPLKKFYIFEFTPLTLGLKDQLYSHLKFRRFCTILKFVLKKEGNLIFNFATFICKIVELLECPEAWECSNIFLLVAGNFWNIYHDFPQNLSATFPEEILKQKHFAIVFGNNEATNFCILFTGNIILDIF